MPAEWKSSQVRRPVALPALFLQRDRRQIFIWNDRDHQTGDETYKLNHFALSYDQTTGVLDGKVNIREEVKVNANRNAFSGTFTIAVYDPTGTNVVHQVQGDITGTRVTVNTSTP